MSVGHQSDYNPRAWRLVIALEGPSGCGKSALLPILSTDLKAIGIPNRTVANNEIGEWASTIRRLANLPNRALTLAYATAASRAEMREIVTENEILISDRYVLSTFVYQRYSGIPFEQLYAINRELLQKTVTIFLEIEVGELELRRCGRAAQATDWFKLHMSATEEIDLYEAAADMLKRRGHPIFKIDAAHSMKTVSYKICIKLKEWLKDHSYA